MKKKKKHTDITVVLHVNNVMVQSWPVRVYPGDAVINVNLHAGKDVKYR